MQQWALSGVATVRFATKSTGDGARVTALVAHPALVASALITQPTDPVLLSLTEVPSFEGRTGLG